MPKVTSDKRRKGKPFRRFFYAQMVLGRSAEPRSASTHGLNPYVSSEFATKTSVSADRIAHLIWPLLLFCLDTKK